MALQFAVALIVIIFLTWLVTRLRLGSDARIVSEAHAAELADQIVAGFVPRELAVDRGGCAAIMRDSRGRILVVRGHGARFVGRILDDHNLARLDHTRLILATRDRKFGTVTLELGRQAPSWAAKLRYLDQ